jgi:tetratricopeptide (TPR) repeat protein
MTDLRISLAPFGDTPRFDPSELPSDFISHICPMLAVAPRDPIVDKLELFANALAAASRARASYAASWAPFGLCLQTLVMAKNPGVSSVFPTLLQFISQVSSAESDFSKALVRASDDFRDVVERYGVLYRQNEAYFELHIAFERASEALANAVADDAAERGKAGYERSRARFERAIVAARETKRRTLAAARTAVQELIVTRERYKRFKLRRTEQGWRGYAEAAQEFARRETEAFTGMRKEIEALKAAGKMPPEDAERYLERMRAAPAEGGLIGPPVGRGLIAAVAEVAEAVIGSAVQGGVGRPADAGNE